MNNYIACITNKHGRILSSTREFNRKFCFSNNNECIWHYIQDLIKNHTLWKSFVKSVMEREDYFYRTTIIMKNRKRRGFKCTVIAYHDTNENIHLRMDNFTYISTGTPIKKLNRLI